ncbi:HTH domain-containing protein [Acidithiobacillus ferrianus]|uniref:HTH domain-containing protein n=1 Tax=Acidithiobacillus ferrianus TaxID=2678518 RepID=A0ACD5HDR0_9PROT|nr:HTH domain-containing protein [Acidithiobacillus ferrianus]
MSRAQRLLALIQILRRHRFAVTGANLAEELGISLRTLYRDIATLQEQGASIEGEPGMGYVLRPGFMLPPLMFSEEEIEALVLGARWVAALGVIQSMPIGLTRHRADQPDALVITQGMNSEAAGFGCLLKSVLKVKLLRAGPDWQHLQTRFIPTSLYVQSRTNWRYL